MGNHRVVWIDNAKAIGIFLVVLGHLKLPHWLTYDIYAFHMPLFFFLSGYTFQTRGNPHASAFLFKKARALLAPYFIFSFLTYLFWLVIGRKFGADAGEPISPLRPFIGIFYSVGVDDWMTHNVPMWFLTCLFVTESAFYFVARRAATPVLIAIAALCAVAGFVLGGLHLTRLPWSMDVALVAVSLYALGYLARGLKLESTPRLWLPVLAAVCLSLGYLTSQANGLVDMNSLRYGQPALFYAGALLGILAVFALASLIPQNRVLDYLGRNTLTIMALHGVAGSVVKAVIVFGLGVPLAALDRTILANGAVAVCTILLLVPPVFIINRYLPFILGKGPALDRLAARLEPRRSGAT